MTESPIPRTDGNDGVQQEGESCDDGRLTRVSSRSNVAILRGGGVVSEGGSILLMDRMGKKLKRERKSLPSSSMTSETSNTSQKLSWGQDQGRIRPGRLSFSYLNMLISDLDWALTELDCRERIDLAELERIAIILDCALTQESRHYHNVAHVYEISAGASPLQVLASLFRDVIKNSIDRDSCSGCVLQWNTKSGTKPSLYEYLQNFFVENDGSNNPKLIIRPDLSDPQDVLLANIFGFRPGDDLTERKEWFNKGLDMFLSALVATRILKNVLTMKLTGQLCACIEATIPFRCASHVEGLHKRVLDCNQDFELGMTKEEIQCLVQQACDLWNRQVGNMASEDAAVFLDHTWSLLPQHERTLRRKTLYTLNDYHSAIVAMDQFLSSLVPPSASNGAENDLVYLSYEGIPSQSEITSFRERFETNLAVALSYVRARLLSVTVVAAMAQLTGGDGPKSYFFGDIPSLNQLSVNLGDLVPTSTAICPSCNKQVLELLQSSERRLMDVGFDHRNTGVAGYLYAYLGEKELQTLVVKFCRKRVTESSSLTLLRVLPLTQVVEPILNAFSFMAASRAPAAKKLLAELQSLQPPEQAIDRAAVTDNKRDTLMEVKPQLSDVTPATKDSFTGGSTTTGHNENEERVFSKKNTPLPCRMINSVQQRRRQRRRQSRIAHGGGAA